MKDIILYQNSAELKKLKYGLFPMSYNGCEVIAAHNALRLLGLDSSLQQMRSYFYRSHLCLWFGLWGSKVSKLDRIKKDLPIDIIPVSLQYILSISDGVFIISFWNTNPPWHGIHTVACEVKNHQFKTYNLYTNVGISDISPMDYASSRFICAFKISTQSLALSFLATGENNTF